VKNNSTFLIFLAFLFSQFILGQTLYRKKVNGKIMVDSLPVVAANIVNQSSKEATVSDMQGAFVIDVREGDVLLFSAVNVMAREVIVDKSVIAQSNMTIVMEYVNIQLNEVVIQEASRLSAESIGIIPYGQKRYTQAERHLQTAGDFKPIMLLGLLAGSMPFDPVINKISGRTKRLKKLVVLERKIAVIDKLDEFFNDDFYSSKLKIPHDYIGGFKFYVIENNTFVTYLKNNDLAMAKFLLIELAASYNEVISCEN
jgi:hypothetical protein